MTIYQPIKAANVQFDPSGDRYYETLAHADDHVTAALTINEAIRNQAGNLAGRLESNAPWAVDMVRHLTALSGIACGNLRSADDCIDHIGRMAEPIGYVSPEILAAFCAWVEAKAAASDEHLSDEAAGPLDRAEADAMKALVNMPATTAHEIVLKLYLCALSTHGCRTAFDLKRPAAEGYDDTIWHGIIPDLAAVSPLIAETIASKGKRS